MHGAYGTVATLRKGRVKLIRRKAVLGALVGAMLVLSRRGALAPPRRSTRLPRRRRLPLRSTRLTLPHIDPAEFSTSIDNEYFPLEPGLPSSTREAKSATRWLSLTTPKKVMGVEVRGGR